MMAFILMPLIAMAAYFSVTNALSGEYVRSLVWGLLMLGSGMNCAVVLANGLKMPVTQTGHIVVPRALEIALYPVCFWFFIVPSKPNVHVHVESSRLLFLADRIQIYGMQASIGDMFISFGIAINFCVLIYEMIEALIKLL